ncbi:MAG: group 1 truncated hemoglobin [Calditrichaeota bacterium]|nr:MAG: group 1 truncated hemoglobin [Calditrichota bacterium]
MKFKNVVGTMLICVFCITAFSGLGIAEESADAKPSLYDRLGGLPAISVVVSDFLDVMEPDSILNMNPAIEKSRYAVPKEYLKYQVTAMVCQATGGPCQYTGRNMAESHAHLNITEAEWDRMVELVTSVFAKHNVPEAEVNELMAIVGTLKKDIVTK